MCENSIFKKNCFEKIHRKLYVKLSKALTYIHINLMNCKLKKLNKIKNVYKQAKIKSKYLENNDTNLL